MIEIKLFLAFLLLKIFKDAYEKRIIPYNKYPLIDKDGYEINSCSSDSEKKFIPLKEYISENAKIFCQVYFIDEDIPNFLRVNLIEKNRVDFFAYLDTIGIEHNEVGNYFFFRKKQK